MEALAAKSLGPEDHGGAGHETGEDASDGADPVVVDGPLEEERRRNKQGNDADAAEELGADAVFERTLVFRKMLGEVGSRRVFRA